MSETALLSLAVLKSVLEEQQTKCQRNHDYFHLYVPFVAESLRGSIADLVSVPELQVDLRRQFGLSIPRHVLDTILKRVRSVGYITLKNKVYVKKPEKLRRFEFPAVRDKALQEYRDLVNTLCTFCATEHSVHWSEAEAQAALESFVQDRHLAIVQAMTTDTEWSVADRPEDGARYLVGDFIRFLLATEARELQLLETVLQGSMLASAVYFPDVPHPERGFESTIVFCDSTFLLFALGHAGDEFKAPCTELLDLLKETGAALACFEHTVDEMRGILEGCAYRLERHGNTTTYDPDFLQYCLQTQKTSLDMHLASAQVKASLEGLGVSVVSTPSYEAHEHVVDEVALTASIEGRINYGSSRALERDVQSISAIMRLRQGKTSRSVETCVALLLTSNSALASVAAHFFRPRLGSASIPPCITDQALTSLLWLKRPARAPQLARKWLIADSYAAVNPSRRLWGRYAEELEKCRKSGSITDEQYYLMRYSTSAPAVLMEATQGNEAVLTQASVPQLQTALEERIRQKALADREAEMARMTEELFTAQQERTAAADREAKRRSAVELNAVELGKKYFRAVKTSTVALFLAAALTSLLGYLPAWVPPWGRWLVLLLGLAYAVMGAANVYFGLALGPWLEKLEARFVRWLTRRHLRHAGFEGKDAEGGSKAVC